MSAGRPRIGANMVRGGLLTRARRLLALAAGEKERAILAEQGYGLP